MDKRGTWDKSLVLSRFFFGAIIAIIGIVFTITFSQEQAKLTGRQIEISQMQALEAFIPYLEDEKPQMRKFAAKRIADVAGGLYVTELAAIYKTEELLAVAEEARASGLGVGQTKRPEEKIATASVAVFEKSGWAYLGHYDNEEWKTNYFEFDDDPKPENLVGTTQTVRELTGSLNVREGMPDVVGRFPKVIDVLEVGSSVRIVDVREWHSSGFWWADVRYR